MARWTVQGRVLAFDGKPFVYIDKEEGTRPVEADGAAKLIVDLFNREGVTPDSIYERHMGKPPRRARETGRRRMREGDDETEVWIDAPGNDAGFLAQRWYSGQGDPLYALGSTGFPQPESTISWALSNATKSETEQWKHIEKKYGKRGAQKLMAIDPESREARALPDEKREDLEATEEISQLVRALQEALDQGERISAEEGLSRQGVAPGTRW